MLARYSSAPPPPPPAISVLPKSTLGNPALVGAATLLEPGLVQQNLLDHRDSDNHSERTISEPAASPMGSPGPAPHLRSGTMSPVMQFDATMIPGLSILAEKAKQKRRSKEQTLGMWQEQ